MTKGLKAAQAARAALKEAGTKVARSNPVERASKNPASLRLAINAMCYTCEGGDSDPDVSGRIRNCTIPECPLYRHRPYQKK